MTSQRLYGIVYKAFSYRSLSICTGARPAYSDKVFAKSQGTLTDTGCSPL